VNHATALAGINSARYAQRRGNALPLLMVCEDNGIGISTETPRRWVRDAFEGLGHLRYIEAAGDLASVYDAAARAVEQCRRTRGPVLLHLRCVRLWGHAGSDVETVYRSLDEIAAIERQDPLLQNARLLVESGAATPATLAAIVHDARTRVAAAAEEAARRPHLSTREAVVAPLAPYDEPRVRAAAERALDPDRRAAHWEKGLPENATAATKRTLGSHINAALKDAMAADDSIVVFGEDVGRKGGVYYVTAGLQKEFGIARVFDTLLDETTILGVAQGAGLMGLLPVAEIQYLAYVHNAIDQLRGEACSLSYFSAGQFANPMVVRIASFAYQKGFGGHFHNANSIGALRDIPGLVLATPSRGDDAVRMLRGCLAMARACGRVVCFLEPIALYHEKDLYEAGDGQWLTDYPPPGEALLPGEPGVHGDGEWLIVSYANGVRLSLRAARRIAGGARVLDVRWLNPLPAEAIRAHAREKGKVLVVDECRATGAGIADAVIADLAESGFTGILRSVRAADCYVPLGPATNAVLVTEDQIVEAAQA
jgi:2-oxoisovalerate dehydrogenase E1 component